MARTKLNCLLCLHSVDTETDTTDVVCSRCSIYLSLMTVEQAEKLHNKAVKTNHHRAAEFIKSQMPEKRPRKS